ncbi:zinc finger, CCHC-type containing protein [Tanacetum coccineum]|uniref:Zinc finger, CCHC-type containing protein n=1 Tax=Tanacetum coccineum TaxID=301880 RepID=A0ABQ5GFP1_9ASTR
MAVAAMKHMASTFSKLDKFEGVNFRRWLKKMHFLLSGMSVVYVMTTLIPEDDENATMEQIKRRNKWENDDYVCRGLILNGMSDPLFDILQNVKSSKELWDSLEAKYMAGDASSKKFFVSNFINYKMTDSRPVIEQYKELGMLGKFTQHKMNMDEAIQISCIIDKLPPSWKDFKHTLKHKKEELTLIELGSHLRIEEFLRVHDSNKPKRNNVVAPSIVNMDDDVAWWVDSGAIVHVCKERCWFKIYESLNDGSILHMGNESTVLVYGRHVHYKRMQDMSKHGLFPAFDMDTEKYDASRFCYVYLLHSKDEALDKFKMFKTEVELQQKAMIKRFRTDRRGLSQGFWSEAMAVVRLPDPKLKTLGERGIECIFVGCAKHSKAFRFSVIEPNDSVSVNSIIELRDAISDENRFSSVLRPKAINDEMDSIMGNNTWVLVDIPPVCKPLGCKWIFKKKMKVDGTVEKFKARLIIHQMDVKTSFLNSELDEEAPKQWHQKFDEVVLSSGYLLNQADKCVYRKFDESGKGVIICLYVNDKLIFGIDQAQVEVTKEFLSSRFFIKDMWEADVILVSTPMDTSEKLRPNNGQAVSQLKYSRVIGCLMYAMTCTRPDVAFVVVKLSSCCPTTLAKAYSQMYNGKSRNLGVRHSMSRELIMNGVVSIEFVRSQQNLADHLTNGLARDLVLKSAEGKG